MPDLQRPVVVDGATFDDGANVIAVRERVGQPPQHNDADAVAGNRSPGIRVERPAMAVG